MDSNDSNSTAKDAMATVIRITLKHTADVLTTMMGVVAEHYKIDPEEMMEVVRIHPRFQALSVEPMLHDLCPLPTMISETPVAAASTAAAANAVIAAKKRGPKKLAEMTTEERAAHDIKMAERKAAKAIVPVVPVVPVVPEQAIPSPDPSPDPESIAVTEPVTEPPKVMKMFKIKPKASKDT